MSEAKNLWIAGLGAEKVYADGEQSIYRIPRGFDMSNVSVVLGDDEQLYESRIYRILPPGFGEDEAHHMKVLAKTRADGRIWFLMKLENAIGRIYRSGYGDETGWVTEQRYRDEVARMEAALGAIGAAEAQVATADELSAKVERAARVNRG